MNNSTVKTYLPWVVAVALFMEQLDTTIVNTAVPAMAESLQVAPLSLKAVVTSYILSLAVCIPVSGWRAERFGTRRGFRSGGALLLAGCGLIVRWLTWRYIFFINVPVGLLALWLAHRHMPDYRGDTRRPLDIIGLVLFGSGAALLSWLLEIFGEHELDASSGALLLALSLGLLAAYFWHARRRPHPLLRLALFRGRTVRISVVVGF